MDRYRGLLLSGVEGCDGDLVVVDVERGIGGFVVDSRAVPRFCDRVEVVWEGRSRVLWVRTVDKPLACAIVGGHEVSAFLGDEIRSVWMKIKEGDGPLACAVADFEV